MSFRMKAVSFPAEAAAYESLQFLAHSYDALGRVTRQFDPVRGSVMGAQLEYGTLFAYLFRRFGYPNAECERQRLARYVLATPLPDMYLVVEPTIGGASDQVLSFFAPAVVNAAGEAFRLDLVARLSRSGQEFWARAPQLQCWEEGDQLKPYAQAAERTLQGLLHPVMLDDDGAIDVFGETPRTARALRPAILDLHRAREEGSRHAANV